MEQKKLLKKFLKFQQKELDAVYMYQLLAKKTKNEDYKRTFFQLAKDEGRHASVFFSYTKVSLKPKKLLGNFVDFARKVFGYKILLKVVAKKEYKAFETYKPYIELYEDIKVIQEDEYRHGDILTSLLN